MLKKFNIGIMGAGNIAGVMAATVKKMKNAKLYAVASREQVKADVFAGRYGCKKAYGSYEDLVKDKKVDLIYIATPHSEHYENAKLCITNGKAVLCEKAFTANAQQARELIDLAREHHVLIAEAMWIRYMPMLTTIQQVIGSGVIGEPKMLTANLGYAINHVKRLTDPALAGGALLDVGIYPLNFAVMLFGHSIEKIDASCTYTETGVDEQESITLHYRDGKMAVLSSSMLSLSDRKGIIYGTRGFAVVENINNFESIAVYDASYKQVAFYKRPKQITGYEYEVEACMRALKSGEIECQEMPHSETIRMMQMMDDIRSGWGIVYPFEKNEEASLAQEAADDKTNAIEEKTEAEVNTGTGEKAEAEANTGTEEKTESEAEKRVEAE